MEGYSTFNLRLPTDSEAGALISTLSAAGSGEQQAEAFVRLSRWARQISQRQQHSPGVINVTNSQQQTHMAAVKAAVNTLNMTSASTLGGAAAILLLGSAAGALEAENSREFSIEQVSEVVGTALLTVQTANTQIEQQQGNQMVVEFLISGTAALLPTLKYNADASCWIFAALLNYLGTISSTNSTIAKSLVSFYPAMRTATAAIVTASTSSQQQSCLSSLYGALRAVLLPQNLFLNGLSTSRMGGEDLNTAKNSVTVAAATLAAGGMLEALVRHQQSRPFPPLIPLIEALAELLKHSATATLVNTTPSSTTRGSASTSTLQTIAMGVAMAQTYQACRRPRPTPATLQICIEALLDTVLNIEPLLEVLKFASNASAGQLSAALDQQAQQHGWNQYAMPLQLTAVSQLSQVRLSPEQLADVLEVIKNAARRTHEQYRQYILHFWTQERAHVDYRPLQSLLEKKFLACMELLAAATTPSNVVNSGNFGKSTLSASSVLCIIADLQFCRVNNSPHYAQLLKNALQSLPLDLASSSSAAVNDVVCCLPAYTDLEARVPEHGNAPAWLVDALSASKVQLVLTAVTPCCRSLSEDVALNILAPLAFLYLLHPHSGTSIAAHTVLWSLMGARAQHAQQLTPYYITRCLERLPLSSSVLSSSPAAATGEPLQQYLQHFSQGLSTALATVPTGSPLGLLAVERILGKCSEMAGAAAGGCWDDLCVSLFNVAIQQLLTVEYTLVDGISLQIQKFILSSPVRLRGRLSQAVLGLVVGTEDCVRKPRLAIWYQNLSATTITMPTAIDASL